MIRKVFYNIFFCTMFFSLELQSIFNSSDLEKEAMQPRTGSSQVQQKQFPSLFGEIEDQGEQMIQLEFLPISRNQSDIFDRENIHRNPFCRQMNEEPVQQGYNLDQNQNPQKNETLDKQELVDYVFTAKDLLKGTVKNTNFPKFLLKNLQSYFLQHAEQILLKPQEITNVARKIRRLKYRNKSKNLMALKSILTRPAAKNSTAFMTRLIFNDILLKNRRNEIIENNHVQNKRSYLNAAKVYALRCRSEGLIQRLTSR